MVAPRRPSAEKALFDLALEGGILLKGSIVDQVEVISAGQEVHDLDAEEPQFDWNESWNWED